MFILTLPYFQDLHPPYPDLLRLSVSEHLAGQDKITGNGFGSQRLGGTGLSDIVEWGEEICHGQGGHVIICFAYTGFCVGCFKTCVGYTSF